MNLLYIIGTQGVGKSALVAELVKGKKRRVVPKPFVHTVYEGGLVQLGRERANGFSGTDALSMSVSPSAIAALESGAWPRVLAEGDRLAHPKFFDAAKSAGYNVDVVLLTAPQFVLTKRRQERGSNQKESWVQGRVTKIERLDSYVTIRLDATAPVTGLAKELQNHPVFG